MRQSRKIWVVAEMLRQEVIQHSASTRQSITEIPMGQAVKKFPTKLFRVARTEKGPLGTEKGELLPKALKYEVLTPNKVQIFYHKHLPH